MGRQSKQVKSRQCKKCKTVIETNAAGIKKHSSLCNVETSHVKRTN